MRIGDPQFPNNLTRSESIARGSVESPEKEKAILRFVTENLPETEERIKEPMNPNCMVCVVLPAYNERKYILRPLGSLAAQVGVNKDQYEVIVVVNNPPSDSQRFDSSAAENNQKTLNLIRHISDESIPVDLTEEEQILIQRIKQSGLRVFAVDKASPNKTLKEEDANVGGARNRGVAEAIERFLEIKRNGILAHSDAEIRFTRTYLKELLDIFQKDPELIGVTGAVGYEDSAEYRNVFGSLSSFTELKDVYMHVRHLYEEGIRHEERIFEGPFDGSNMASRAFETALVGGIPKIKGSEDTFFGKNLTAFGKTEEVRFPETITLRRFSPRTTTGRGLDHMRAAEDFLDKKEILVPDPAAMKELRAKLGYLTEAIASGKISPADLDTIMNLNGQSLLSGEHLEKISQELNMLLSRGLKPNEVLAQLVQNPELGTIWFEAREKAYDILPHISLLEASQHILDLFLNDPHLKERYIPRREKISAERNKYVERRRKIVHKLLQIIFENKPEDTTPAKLISLFTARKDEFGLSEEEVENLQYRDDVLQVFSEIIKNSTTETEAFATIEEKFADALNIDDPFQTKVVEMNALSEALDERIGDGLYYWVYDFGDGKVRKYLKSQAEQEKKLVSWGKSKEEVDLKLSEATFISEQNRRIRELLEKHKNLLLLFGNPVFENNNDYSQDKVTTLRDYLKQCSLEEGKRTIDQYVSLVHILWQHGIADHVFNFTVNNGLTEDGQVILIDLNEVIFEKSEITDRIDKQSWLQSYSYESMPAGPLKDYIQKKFEEEFTLQKLEEFWPRQF